jgi:hypothetical protein
LEIEETTVHRGFVDRGGAYGALPSVKGVGVVGGFFGRYRDRWWLTRITREEPGLP